MMMSRIYYREAPNGPRDEEAPSVLTELSQSPVTTVSATNNHTRIATANHERRLTAECASTCYGKPCDYWLSGDYSCSDIESWGCDCTTPGCACRTPVPTTFAPTVTVMPTTTTTAPTTRPPTTTPTSSLAPTEACDGIELSSGSEWVAASDKRQQNRDTHGSR